MARVKDNKPKEFQLTEWEFKFTKDLNNGLQLHIYREQYISAFLGYIATTRLGLGKVKEGYTLQYGLDLSGDDKTLTVAEVKIPTAAA